MNINFKRKYPLIILVVLLAAVLTFALGDMRVIAYASSTSSAEEASIEEPDYTNDISLLDDTVVHEIQVIMDEADYGSMLTTYQETGLKEYFKADVIIDGVRINDVDIRL